MAKFLIHIGTGADRKTYAYEEEAVGFPEAILIEDATGGLAWPEFKDAIGKGSPRAIVALVWMLRRREEPGLLIEQVDFKLGDLDVEEIPEPEAPKGDSVEGVPPTAN